jgi:glycosyltransferase involved in cell wall biosynthesis
MRILLVAMSDSVHTARWTRQLSHQGWDIHLFPSIDVGITHAELANVTVHHAVFARLRNSKDSGNRYRGLYVRFASIALLARYALQRLFPDYRVWQLRRLIRSLRPDLVHSLEIQHSGYLVQQVRSEWQGHFPKWWVTNWGSDIYLFGRLEEHRRRIRSIMEACDLYSCECERDVGLARALGFDGPALPVMPNTGGFDLAWARDVRDLKRTSERRTIMLKGYQHWAGRALVGLRALERCADVLSGYTVVIYSASHDVMLAAQLFSESTGIETRIMERDAPHESILRAHAAARVSIGLSISDAISTSLLEAMVMGAFPIQSCTACAGEWIQDGQSGWLVPPEDPDVVELAIRAVLADDELVDSAARINWQTALARLEQGKLAQQAVAMYRQALAPDQPEAERNGT